MGRGGRSGPRGAQQGAAPRPRCSRRAVVRRFCPSHSCRCSCRSSGRRRGGPRGWERVPSARSPRGRGVRPARDLSSRAGTRPDEESSEGSTGGTGGEARSSPRAGTSKGEGVPEGPIGQVGGKARSSPWAGTSKCEGVPKGPIGEVGGKVRPSPRAGATADGDEQVRGCTEGVRSARSAGRCVRPPGQERPLTGTRARARPAGSAGCGLVPLGGGEGRGGPSVGAVDVRPTLGVRPTLSVRPTAYAG